MSAGGQLNPIAGSEVDLTGAKSVGRPHPNERIEVNLLLRYGQSSPGLPSLEVLSSQSPYERKVLSHDEFESLHGADHEDVALVQDFAAEHGLIVVDVNRAQRLVTLSATISAVERAFGVKLAHYEHPDFGQFRAHAEPISIPSELAAVVTGVFGIDTRPVAKPHFRHSDAQPRAEGYDAYPGSFPPNQVAELYNFPANTTGKGMTVAVIELGGGYELQYLSEYFQQIGVPGPEIAWVGVGGAQNSPGGQADGEVYLDIEVIGAAAPGAHQVVYFAPGNGLLQALKTAVHDTNYTFHAISLSWGAAESANSMYRNAVDETLHEAVVKGMPVCVAAGDDGSSDGVSDGLAHVDFPASSPYALACGGTTLRAAGNSIDSEVVWNEMSRGSGSTGGGVSAYFPVPAYQQNAKLDPQSANPGNLPGRGVPDVAGNADPVTGYLVKNGPNPLAPMGGTSAVAPLWAALIVRLNEAVGAPAAFLNPFLYQNAASAKCFRDVTEGNNMSPGTGGYSAGTGWDSCTGWGSPDGEALAGQLKVLFAAQSDKQGKTSAVS